MLTHTQDLEQLRPDLLPATSSSDSSTGTTQTSPKTTTAGSPVEGCGGGPSYFDGSHFISLPPLLQQQQSMHDSPSSKKHAKSRGDRGRRTHSHSPASPSSTSTKAAKQQHQGGWHLFRTYTLYRL